MVEEWCKKFEKLDRAVWVVGLSTSDSTRGPPKFDCGTFGADRSTKLAGT